MLEKKTIEKNKKNDAEIAHQRKWRILRPFFSKQYEEELQRRQQLSTVGHQGTDNMQTIHWKRFKYEGER